MQTHLRLALPQNLLKDERKNYRHYLKILNKNNTGKFSLIYKKHSHEDGLISSYDKNINEAVKKRDQIAIKSMEYMLYKITNIKF